MSTIDEKLNEVLDIAEEVFEGKKEVAIVPSTTPKNTDPDVDFETGRENLYKLLAKGNEAIDGILSLAKEGEHPRAYEVAGQLIKSQSEIAQNLLDLQDKLKKIIDDNKEIINITPEDIALDTLELQEESNLDSHSQKD